LGLSDAGLDDGGFVLFLVVVEGDTLEVLRSFALKREGWALGHASTVRKICALTNLNDVAVRIADVAADLAVFGQRLRDELGSSTFP